MESLKDFQRAVTARIEIEELPTSIVSVASPPAAAAAAAVGGNDDAIYVAVGKEKKDAETTLVWALHNSGGKKIYVLHVHSPSQRISMMGAYVPISRLEEHRVRAYHESERQDTHKLLEKYITMCRKAGVRAEKLYIESDSIEKGISELILSNGIKRLVMGAAANKHYSKKMMVPKSTKANYLRLQAPVFCHIWFVCKGHLIHTREASSNGVKGEVISPGVQAHPITGALPRSLSEMQTSQVESTSSILEHRRMRSYNPCLSFSSESTGGETPDNRVRDYMVDDTGGETPQNRISVSIHRNIGNETPQSGMRFSVCESFEGETPQSTISVEGGSPDIWGSVARRSCSGDSHFSSCSSSEMGDDSASVSAAGMDENGSDLVLMQTPRQPSERHFYESPSQRVIEGSVRDELYDRLQEYVQESENSRRAAYEESVRRRKAESDALEARRRAKASEAMLSEELRRRKEIEDLLETGKEETERMKLQLEEVKRNLQLALEEKSTLDSQIENSEKVIKELEEKMFLSLELLQKYQIECDKLQLERDNALWETEELRKSQSEEASNAMIPSFFSEYLLTEIKEATHDFDPAVKIGQGGYGSIYKGMLHHTQVAIKVLDSGSSQGPQEFRQEVNILSNMRHPNLVNLLGVCHEAWALIYELLPNGSLEDRLSCKDNSQPLSWQTRIRIAAELCSVLIFLHNCRPQGIVHGDLKPANLLLDANYVSKLSDFGICRVIYDNGTTGNNTTVCYRTDPKGTFAYMDPEFLATGELTAKSDVYSFGIILLRLLTGKSALGIRKEVQSALDKDNLKEILDPTAGDWPFVRAKQLVHLGLSCCEISRKNRPDLAKEVWRVLEPMRVSCGASPSRLNSEKRSRAPSYFICPLFQEMMRDPMVAADGYTYEAEAMRGWLDSGHDTSPMTNHKLTHSNLVPNRALRSAIQEWLQQQQQQQQTVLK